MKRPNYADVPEEENEGKFYVDKRDLGGSRLDLSSETNFVIFFSLLQLNQNVKRRQKRKRSLPQHQLPKTSGVSALRTLTTSKKGSQQQARQHSVLL